MKFFTVKDIFGSKEYAEYVVVDAKVGDSKYCQLCNEAISPLEWLSPKKVELLNTKFGDFLFGSGPDIKCSERVRDAFIGSNLSGILNFELLDIIKIRYLKNKNINIPKYYFVHIIRPKVLIDVSKTFVNYEREPKCICGSGGNTIGMGGFSVDISTWQNEDIFYMIGYWNPIFSQRFIDFVLENKFTNIDFVETEDYKWGDLKPRIKKWIKPV